MHFRHLALFLLLFTAIPLHAQKAVTKKIDRLNSEIQQCWKTGDYPKGLKLGKEGLAYVKTHPYPKGEAALLHNMGIIHDYTGDYGASLRYYFKALTLFERLKDEDGIASVYSDIGLIYSNQADYGRALAYHQKALKLRKKLGNRSGISGSHNNIGIVYMNLKKYDDALYHYFASAKIDSTLNDKQGIGDTYNNIAVIYMQQGKLTEAEQYFLQSTAIRTELGDSYGLATSYNNLGTIYYRQKKDQLALEWLHKALAAGEKIGATDNIRYSHELLSDVYEALGEHQLALKHQKEYFRYNEILRDNDLTRAQTQAEMQYEFDKKTAREKLDQEKRDLFRRTILIAVAVFALVTLIFSFFLYKRWKIARNQKNIIQEKNRIVESKNREILDSISYAKRIQSAILPPEKLVKEFLANSFILYKPKDIVAGDFYWMEQQGERIIFAAADCTGHGVPGALVSVVCHNALNRSVREFGLSEPGAILDKTRDIIIGEFAKSEEDVNDGMDISLCSLNTTNGELKWSGANNPLWLVRNNHNEIIELKANKQPIGRYSKYEAFETHTLQLEQGDQLYLFTDGFADQFGGSDHKKFKAKQMKTLILQWKDRPMDEQRIQFERAFEEWKGELEQVDDVCVIGMRL